MLLIRCQDAISLAFVISSFFSWKGITTSAEGLTPFSSPKLNITEPYIDVSLNSVLYLLCSGTSPLLWKFEDPLVKYDEPLKDRSSGLIASSDSIAEGQVYESVIRIKFDSYLKTGNYICYHDEQFPLNKSASVYIFVNDLNNLFLPSTTDGKHMEVDVFGSDPASLPCFPTVSSANVTLWEKGGQKIIPIGERLKFHPTEGFTFTSHYSDEHKSFVCKAQVANVTDKVNLYVNFFPDTYSVPEVYINKKKAEFVFVNDSFSLTCTVIVDKGILVHIEWSFPNPDKNRVIIGKETTEEDDYRMQADKQLTIINAQKEDEGLYQCNATDHAQKKNYYEVHIKVFDESMKMNIDLSRDSNEEFIKDKGDEVQFVVNYGAFPSYRESIAFNWKKGEALLSHKYGKYETEKSDNQLVLKVKDLQISDAGIYTLLADAPGNHENINFSLRVRDEPHITVANTEPCCYLAGRSYTLVCEVEAYPSASVVWRWKPYCDGRPPCVSNSIHEWKEVGDDENMTNEARVGSVVIETDERRSRNISVLATTSGFYECQSENQIGTTRQNITFIVTDVNDGFDLLVDNESPVDQDRFSLTCTANVIYYADIQLTWQPSYHNAPTIDLTRKLAVSRTTYSSSATLNYEKIAVNKSGIYECSVADRRDASVRTNKTVDIVVRDIVKPTFTSTNLNESQIKAKPNQQFALFCYVDGAPQPMITWYRDDKLLSANTSSAKFEDNYQRLIITRIVKEDAGEYECKAENRGGFTRLRTTLKVDTVITEWKQKAFIAVTVIAIVTIVVLLALIARKIYRGKRAKMLFHGFNHELFSEGQMAMFNPEMSLDDQAELLPYDSRWEFPKDRLKLGRTLGQGAFGRVVKAEAIGLVDSEESTDVAVKMLKERADINQQRALLAELKILIHLGQHVNIVNLLGAVTQNIRQGELMVIVEYCRYGNLRHYLLRHRDKFINEVDSSLGKMAHGVSVQMNHVNSEQSTENTPSWKKSTTSAGSPTFVVENPSYREKMATYVNTSLLPKRKKNSYNTSSASDRNRSDGTSSSGGTWRYYCRVDSKEHTVSTGDLYCFAFQCARGMDYLTSRKLIHRDLAARNVLLADDNIVKICDFGLAKDCYKYSNYVKKGDGPLPIKWMAIESIGDKVFTTKSDVWSFGILLWEFFTLGSNPYPGIEIDEEFYRRLKQGYRMEKPEFAPDVVYELMRECWRADPNERPDFTYLSDVLGELLQDSVRQYYVDLNNHYMEMNKQILIHDYLNMDTNEMNIQRDSQSQEDHYVNSPKALSDLSQYDNISSVRPVSNGPIPKEPMEVVPMIRLDSGSEEPKEAKVEFISVGDSSRPKQPQRVVSYSPDYLCMGNSTAKNISADFATTNDDDSVFIDSV